MNRFKLLLFLFVINNYCAFSQYYENGQDPFSINWKKIETPHFKVIFSEDATHIGKMYAAYLEKIYLSGGNSLEHDPRKVPVIIHNQNVISNGEVAWAPRRINLYAVPSLIGDAESYAKHLALHEFRHVVQIDKLNQSTTKVFYCIFGEQIIGAFLGWHIPLWFFEGDAVAYETGASNAGRGQQADFLMELKAQVAEKGIYSYPKAQFGSYKDFVPDHYKLGYELISRGRQKFGDSLWSKTLNQVAITPIHPNAFSMGIKRETGLRERKFYDAIMVDFKSELNVKKITKSKDFVNYLSPYELNEAVYSYRTSFSDIPYIVKTDATEKEFKVLKTGYIFNQTFSMQDSIMVWNELRRTRWENNNYTRIVKYNTASQKKSYLTKKTRAYYSRISPDKKQVLSVEVNKDLSWYISFRNAKNGAVLKKINFGHTQPLQPSWSPTMNEIVFLTLGENGKSLGIMDLATEEITWILKNQYIELDYPQHYGSSITVKGIFNNKSNILEYNLTENSWTAISNSEYGVQEGRVYNNTLLYSEYTANGFKLIKQPKFEATIKIPQILNTKQSLYLSDSETTVDLNTIDTNLYVQNYSRALNLLNIHSWAPLSFSIDNTNVNPGAMFMSQNALSTSTLIGGYEYIFTDNTHRYYIDYSYKGFYPILNVGFSNSFFNQNIEYENQLYSTKWREQTLTFNATLPIVLDRGKWYRRLQTTFMYDFTKFSFDKKNELKYNAEPAHRFYYLAYFANLMQQSHRDLQARWGQTLQLSYMHTPFNVNQYGKLAAAEVQLFFPGVLKNHGIKLYGGAQRKAFDDISFTDQIDYPYGYIKQDNTEMLSYQLFYKFPFLYPDLNVFEFLYFKRFKANLFYQASVFNYNETQHSLSAIGTDLTTDLHVFRFVFPFEIGMRYSRRISNNNNYYGILFNMSF